MCHMVLCRNYLIKQQDSQRIFLARACLKWIHNQLSLLLIIYSCISLPSPHLTNIIPVVTCAQEPTTFCNCKLYKFVLSSDCFKASEEACSQKVQLYKLVGSGLPNQQNLSLFKEITVWPQHPVLIQSSKKRGSTQLQSISSVTQKQIITPNNVSILSFWGGIKPQIKIL